MYAHTLRIYVAWYSYLPSYPPTPPRHTRTVLDNTQKVMPEGHCARVTYSRRPTLRGKCRQVVVQELVLHRQKGGWGEGRRESAPYVCVCVCVCTSSVGSATFITGAHVSPTVEHVSSYNIHRWSTPSSSMHIQLKLRYVHTSPPSSSTMGGTLVEIQSCHRTPLQDTQSNRGP